MHREAQFLFLHGSGDGHREQRTLPCFRDLVAQGHFLPEQEGLTYDQEGTVDVAFPPLPWVVSNPELSSIGPGSSDDHTSPRKESLGSTSTNAHGADDGSIARDTESRVRRWQAESMDSPTTDRPRKRRREAEASIDVGTAPEWKTAEGNTDAKESCRKHENSRTAAFLHKEKERERRLQIGELIKQIASLIRFSGPKVEILKRTVDCIHDAESKREDLEAELENLRSRCQALGKQCSRLSRAVSKSFAGAEEIFSEEIGWREDASDREIVVGRIGTQRNTHFNHGTRMRDRL
ncbi:MAG: hypothetical protein Q9221_001969 [Calogaya cf. arnoldii]